MSSKQDTSKTQVAAKRNVRGKPKKNVVEGDQDHSESAALEEAAAPVKSKRPTKSNQINVDNAGSVPASKTNTTEGKPHGKPKGTGAKKSSSKPPPKLTAKDKGKGKAIENDEENSKDAALNKLINPQGNPNAELDDSDPDTPADVVSSPNSHLSLKITTDDDEAAYKTLLPYLAYGFTTVKTPCSNHNCGLHALKLSLNAARKKYGVHVTPTAVKNWQLWFKSDEYTKAARSYVQDIEKIKATSKIEARVKVLRRETKHRRLDIAQMNCLLRVATIGDNVQFQLGVIKSGYQGKWNNDIGAIDAGFVKQSVLVIAEKTLLARPVLWVYDTNDEERVASHRKKGEESAESAGFGHWEGFTDSKTRIERIQQFCVGERVESDVKAGLWTVAGPPESRKKNKKKSNDKSDEELNKESDEDEGWGIGTLLQGEQRLGAPQTNGDRVELLAGIAPNGKEGEFQTRSLKKINENKHKLSAKTDNKWASTKNKPARAPAPARARASSPQTTNDEEQEAESALAQKIANINEQHVEKSARDHKFFRVIPATTRTGKVSKVTDQVAKNISLFGPDNGEIVLDTGVRGTHYSMRTAEVIRPNKKKGLVYLRRLQPLERAFGFVDGLPTLEPWPKLSVDPKETGLEKFRAVYNSVHDTPLKSDGPFDLAKAIRKLNRRENAKRIGLEVCKLKDSVNKRVSTSAGSTIVQFNKGEYVLRVKEVPGATPKKHTVRDYEGREVDINDSIMEDPIWNAWDYVLRKDAFDDDDDDGDLPSDGDEQLPVVQGAKVSKTQTKKKDIDATPAPGRKAKDDSAKGGKVISSDVPGIDTAPTKATKTTKANAQSKDTSINHTQGTKIRSGALAKDAGTTKAKAQTKGTKSQPGATAVGLEISDKRKTPGGSGDTGAGDNDGPDPKKTKTNKAERGEKRKAASDSGVATGDDGGPDSKRAKPNTRGNAEKRKGSGERDMEVEENMGPVQKKPKTARRG